MEATAVRTWNKAHTKAVVTVTVDGVALKPVGGRRAEQCSFALLYPVKANMPPYEFTGEHALLGLRSSPALVDGCEAAVPIVEAGLEPGGDGIKFGTWPELDCHDAEERAAVLAKPFDADQVD